MKLAPGFVVGGRYRIVELVHAGRTFRVYSAESGEGGPGQVTVKVARHAHVEGGGGSLSGLQAGRQHVADAWRLLKVLHEGASSAAPLPLELVHMYPGDPAVRRVAMVDKEIVRREPYLVCETANGSPLAKVIQYDRVDEERALLLALRVVLVMRSALDVGVLLTDLSANNFVVDHAGENVSIVDVVGVDVHDPPPITDRVWERFGSDDPEVARLALRGQQVAPAFGRLLVALLSGIAAPPWGTGEADRARWEGFIASRRVPREFHALALGCLGYRDAFEATVERVEQRLRALARARKPRFYQHAERHRETPYLIDEGERVAGRFEVLGPLGQGGRGFVYRARDVRSGVDVLIKTNKYQYDAGSAFSLELPTRRQELEHEYAILREFASRTGMLPQPVALVSDMGRGAWFDLAPGMAPDEPYLAMEHIKGIPLLDLLPAPLEGLTGAQREGNRLPPSFVLRLIAQLAELLQTFHDRGYLVQDLKPENVLWDPRSENVYLVDFAAVCPRLEDGTLDEHSVAFGTQTHGFAAPEFAELWGRSDARFDIYSLGATAYHLLTGINPERLALEQGSEYPELPLHALGALPVDVAELVRGCLAPVAERFKSAAAVFTAAEAARLRLSRSRPLDVRGLRVEYLAEGVILAWHLPADPRIDRVRILRARGDEEVCVFEGGRVQRWCAEEPPVDDAEYRVETGLERRGAAIHSRGRSARVEARPAPVVFHAAPYFGGVRLYAEAAAHALGVEVRWSEDMPPSTPTEGARVALEPGEWSLHALPEGCTAHYAAFALYPADDAAASAPSSARFGTATALRALPEVDDLTVTQEAERVRLTWADDDPRWRVAAVGESGARRLLDAGAPGEAIDLQAPDGEAIRYLLFAHEADVDADPVLERSVRRWPASPELRVTAGPAHALVQAGELDPRFTRFDVSWRTPGGAEAGEATFASLPARVALPPNQAMELTVRACVDDGARGPERRFEVCAPPSRARLDVRVRRAHLPVALEVSLPEELPEWSGEYRLEVQEGDAPIALDPNWRDASRVTLERDDLEPGSTLTWSARLFAPTGDVIAESETSERVLEILGAPSVAAELAAVVVTPPGFAVDVSVERAGGAGDLLAAEVAAPHRFSLDPAEPVKVRWRRSVDAGPMPWSPVTELAALARPPAPERVRLSFVGGRPTLAWEAPAPGLAYRVSAPGGRAVYEGAATEATDWHTPSAGVYEVVSLRDGLTSAPAESPAVGEAASAAVTAPARDAREPDASARLMQCVGLRRDLSVIELWTPGPSQRLVVVAAQREVSPSVALRALDEGALPPSRWLGSTRTTGARTVLPFKGSGPVHVCSIADRAGAGARLVRGFVEPVEGVLVGALVTEDGELQLSPAGSWKGPFALTLFREGAPPERVALTGDPASPIALPEDDHSVVALGLEAPLPATVLVALSEAGDRPEVRVWHDALRGAMAALGAAASEAWAAPIVSEWVGLTSVFHYLRDASHVELSVTLTALNARGRATLEVRARSADRYLVEGFRLELGSPRAVLAFPADALKRLTRAAEPAQLTRWGLG